MDRLQLLIKCPKCNCILENPVLLPCGCSICKKHVNLDDNKSTNLEENKLICFKCDVDHSIPDDGFPLNMSLVALLQTDLAHIDLGEIYKLAKASCGAYRDVIEKMNLLMKDPEYYIHDAINNFIKDIDLRKEELIFNISQTADKITNELKEIETYCRNTTKEMGFSSSKEYIEFNEQLQLSKKQLDEWQNYMEQLQINEHEWKKIHIESDKRIKELKEEMDKFKRHLLDEKIEDIETKKNDFFQINVNIDRK